MYYTHSLLQPHFCDLLPGKRKGGRCNGDFRIMVNTQLTRMHMHIVQIATYAASTAYLSRITHQSKEGGGGGCNGYLTRSTVNHEIHAVLNSCSFF